MQITNQIEKREPKFKITREKATTATLETVSHSWRWVTNAKHWTINVTARNSVVPYSTLIFQFINRPYQ